MDVQEIVKSITELEAKLNTANTTIDELNSQLEASKVECQEVKDKMKKVLSAILANVKDGLAETKEKK